MIDSTHVIFQAPQPSKENLQERIKQLEVEKTMLLEAKKQLTESFQSQYQSLKHENEELSSKMKEIVTV